MPRYKVVQKCFILDKVWNVGEIIDFPGPGNEDYMQPIDGARMQPRKFDIEGGAGLSLEKRAECFATRQPDKPWS
jgi:hypothetical protein